MTFLKNHRNLAIFGGSPKINYTFKKYRSIGLKEVAAATKVVMSGNLSQFLGEYSPDFFGGPNVRKFEREAEEYFQVKHAITVNSWTSGLVAAVGAIEIEPGDEIITSPWTMSASATAILQWNGIPVFSDISSEDYCLDVAEIEKNISMRTKAILAIDIFGRSSKIDELIKLGKKHNLKIITDSAQSPGAVYHNHKASTLSSIGGFSLNYHKHIHTGEGGILVTNDDHLAMKLRLIRNHGEVVAKKLMKTEYNATIGFNYRLGEIEAAIGIQQLRKLDKIIDRRIEIANTITEGLSSLEGLKLPKLVTSKENVFYAYPMQLELEKTANRHTIVQSLRKEGVQGLAEGYQNIHLLPIYQNKKIYNYSQIPWSLGDRKISYDKGICPVAEYLHDHSYIGFGFSSYKMSRRDVRKFCDAFKKVWSNMESLKSV